MGPPSEYAYHGFDFANPSRWKLICRGKTVDGSSMAATPVKRSRGVDVKQKKFVQKDEVLTELWIIPYSAILGWRDFSLGA